MKLVKCRILALVLTLVILTSSAASAHAHSGKTDSSGGHYDSSTGTYHYHHGFSAHQHRDIDGDGVVDCPYYFDDKTGQNSGTSGNSRNGVSKNEDTDDSLLQMGFIIALIVIAVLAVKLREKYAEIELCRDCLRDSEHRVSELTALSKQNSADIDSKTQELNKANQRIENLSSRLFNSEKRYYELLYRGKTRAEIADAPAGSFIGADELPCTKIGIDDIHKWGKYTVFFAINGTCYHRQCGCSGAFFAENVVHVEKRLKPCLKCASCGFDLAWFHRYICAMEMVKKYSVKLRE